jgi:hypothetical protein
VTLVSQRWLSGTFKIKKSFFAFSLASGAGRTQTLDLGTVGRVLYPSATAAGTIHFLLVKVIGIDKSFLIPLDSSRINKQISQQLIF